MHAQIIMYPLIIFVFATACRRPQNNIPQNYKAFTNKLIPVDVNDTLYGDFRSDFKEILTADGWNVNYLVKDDSTKYKDIYVKWGKGANVRTLNFPSVLMMRSYFLPVYESETKNYLYFKHGCATGGCTAITALPKDPEIEPHVFNNVVDYDLNRGRIVFTPERSFSLDSLELDIFDLNLNKSKTAKFRNRCNLSPEDSCIEKVIFKDKTVELLGTFMNEDGTTLTEKQTVSF
jgi:hypothetical protein